MKNLELSYVAGFIDGEGCITISQLSKIRYKTPYNCLSVTVSNTNKEVLDWIQREFGGYFYQKKNSYGGKTVFSLNFQCRKAAELLKQVYPFLRIKRNQAQIGLEFQSLKTFGPKKDMKQLNKEVELRNKIRIENNWGGKYNSVEIR